MSTTTTTRLEALREMLDDKDVDIREAIERLAHLDSERQRIAIAGADTAPIRQEIAEVEAERGDLEIQRANLKQQVDDEQTVQEARDEWAVAASIYKEDVEYLQARLRIAKIEDALQVATLAMRKLVVDIGEAHDSHGHDSYRTARGCGRPRLNITLGQGVRLEALSGTFGEGATTSAELKAEVKKFERLHNDAKENAR